MGFLRDHGSIRKMEQLLEISHPTVKNRLRQAVEQLDQTFAAAEPDAPSANSLVLEQLVSGELTVEEALARLE